MFAAIASATAKNDFSDLRGLVLNNAKIPIYDTKQNLQMMVFVDRAVREGKVLVGKNTVLEMIRKGSNVDSINDSWQLKYYALDSTLKSVVNFWLARASYSDGVIITSQANIDQESNRAFGNTPVYFRSPMIDLDGIGFDVNFKKRTIQVNSDVNVVLRMAASDPRKLKADGIDKIDYSYVRAYSDSLLIDIEHNQLMLVGSVKVIDRSSVLTCDRLTIFLDRVRSANRAALEGDNDISRILADGNVIISNGEGVNMQRVVADHLVYDVKPGLFTFTGDNDNPRFEQKQDIISGQKIVIYRDEQQVRIMGSCFIKSMGENGSVRRITSDHGEIDFRINKGAFVGNVRMADSGIVISGPHANLKLASKSGKPVKNEANKQDKMLPGGFGTQGLGGSRELSCIEFNEGIRVQDTAKGKASGGKLNLAAAEGKYDAKGKYIDFERNVKLLDSQMTLNAEKMRIILEQNNAAKSANNGVDRIECGGGVKIVGKGENAGTLTSKRGMFYYKKDLLVFNDNVRLVNKSSKLDCDRLDLYLKSSSTASAKQTGVVGVGGNDKVLTKAVATGKKVKMTDPQGTLETKILTMLFEELPKGAKPVPGMLQSGSSRVVWISCNDGVKLESVAQKGKKDGIFGNSASNRVVIARKSETDLKKNVSVLYDNVSVDDGTSRIECQKMSLYAAAPDKKAGQQVDPDADPFALSANEDGVPKNIMLNSDLELKRVFCEKQVVMSSAENGKKVSAGGDTGEFLAATRKFVISSIPPKRSWLRGEGKLQLCDQIVCDIANNSLYGVGSTETENDITGSNKQ